MCNIILSPQLGPQFSQSDNAAQARDAKEARVKLEKVDVELRKQVELTRELNEKIAEVIISVYVKLLNFQNERKYQQLSEEKEKLEEGKRRLTNDTNVYLFVTSLYLYFRTLIRELLA